jgi:hypothetical protein
VRPQNTLVDVLAAFSVNSAQFIARFARAFGHFIDHLTMVLTTAIFLGTRVENFTRCVVLLQDMSFLAIAVE